MQQRTKEEKKFFLYGTSRKTSEQKKTGLSLAILCHEEKRNSREKHQDFGASNEKKTIIPDRPFN